MLYRSDLEYLIKLDDKIKNKLPITRRNDEDNAEIAEMQLDECSECGEIIDSLFDANHIMIGEVISPIIAICCEGYHPLDAN